jgi:hypothetical protein
LNLDLNSFDAITIMVTTPISRDFSTITDFDADIHQDRLLISTSDNREISFPAKGWIEFVDENMIQLIDGGIEICIEGI